jgi:uncharacterized protein with ParB-like and HNH nuclease domain
MPFSMQWSSACGVRAAVRDAAQLACDPKPNAMVRYLVPIFQRGYVWTLSSQIKPLWRDIVYQTMRLLDARQQKLKYERVHFLGALVLKQQVDTGVRHTAAAEVIDGQQRITTLQLFLVALRDVLKSSGRPILIDRAEGLLSALTNHLQIIEIHLERDDDTQVIFETLNARGAPLLAADLVRNFVRARAMIHKTFTIAAGRGL